MNKFLAKYYQLKLNNIQKDPIPHGNATLKLGMQRWLHL